MDPNYHINDEINMDFKTSIKLETVDDDNINYRITDKHKPSQETQLCVKRELEFLDEETEDSDSSVFSEDMIILDFHLVKEEIEIGPTVFHRPEIQHQTATADKFEKSSTKQSLTKLEQNIKSKRKNRTLTAAKMKKESPEKFSDSETTTMEQENYTCKIKSKSKRKNRRSNAAKMKKESPEKFSDSETTAKKPENFTCKICSKNFTHKGNYKRHMKEFHIENLSAFKCDQCNKTFKRQYALVRHQRSRIRCKVENSKGGFKCDCGKVITQRNNYYRHLTGYCEKYSPESGLFVCDLCGKKITNRTRMQVHIRHHQREKFW